MKKINNYFNTDFLYKCNIIIDKIIRKYKIKLHETLYLGFIIFIFTKFIYNYDHTESLLKYKNLFNLIFLLITIFYLIKIYKKFKHTKNKEKSEKYLNEINYYYILIIILIVIIYLTIFNIIQQISYDYDKNKVRRYGLAVGGYSILLTASILTVFEIVFFYNIVIPNISKSLETSLSDISNKMFNEYNEFKSTLDKDQDLLKIIDTVKDNINNDQIINEQIKDDTVDFVNKLDRDELEEEIRNELEEEIRNELEEEIRNELKEEIRNELKEETKNELEEETRNELEEENKDNNTGGIKDGVNQFKIDKNLPNPIDNFSNSMDNLLDNNNITLDQSQKELGKDIVKQTASNLGIPDDLLTDEFINYIITTSVLNIDPPKRLAMLETLNNRERNYINHLNKYTIFISIIFLSILYLILSKFKKYINKQIKKSTLGNTIGDFYDRNKKINRDLFNLSKFSSYFTVFILILFQINFYFFSMKYNLEGSLSKIDSLDKNKYGSGNEELKYLIYSNIV